MKRIVSEFSKATRKTGLAFWLIALGFLHAMAVKPTVTWDEGLSNHGSHFTNDYGRVVLSWAKTNAMPSSVSVSISKKENAHGAQWQTVGTTTAGALGWSFDLVNASNFTYWVSHDWVPPSPVHTNGVWLGNVVEIPRGYTNAAKMVIVSGQLTEHGRIIAPPQKGETNE